MKNIRNWLAVLIVLAIALTGYSLISSAEDAPNKVRIASLKGPTSMGLVSLMKNESAAGKYAFTVSGTADEIVPLLAKGEIDIALIPCNLASVLYNNTEGSISVAGINTLGVLYVLENGDTIQSVADLKGKTLFSTGKGTTPEYALNYVLKQNGIDPENDLNIEYKSEATEVLQAFAAGQASIVMLPQPFATATLMQVDGARAALSLTDEWNKASPDSALVTGVVVVRNAFAKENPDAFAAFLSEYAASCEFVNANPADAAIWIEELGIAKAAVAEKAIPACNIVLITGDEMKAKVSGYLETLYNQNPKAVGGKLPDDAFYYIP